MEDNNNKIEMEPIGAATSYRTHTLVSTSPNKFILRPSLKGLLITSTFILFPAHGLYSITANPRGSFEHPLGLIFGWIIMSLFIGVGIYVLLKILKPRVFDLKNQVYWKSWLSPFFFSFIKPDDYIKLTDITHIQFIDKTNIDSEGDEFKSYELNLVLNSGGRIHIFDHGDFNESDYCVRQLSSQINVPISKTCWYEKDKDNKD